MPRAKAIKAVELDTNRTITESDVLRYYYASLNISPACHHPQQASSSTSTLTKSTSKSPSNQYSKSDASLSSNHDQSKKESSSLKKRKSLKTPITHLDTARTIQPFPRLMSEGVDPILIAMDLEKNAEELGRLARAVIAVNPESPGGNRQIEDQDKLRGNTESGDVSAVNGNTNSSDNQQTEKSISPIKSNSKSSIIADKPTNSKSKAKAKPKPKPKPSKPESISNPQESTFNISTPSLSDRSNTADSVNQTPVNQLISDIPNTRFELDELSTPSQPTLYARSQIPKTPASQQQIGKSPRLGMGLAKRVLNGVGWAVGTPMGKT